MNWNRIQGEYITPNTTLTRNKANKGNCRGTWITLSLKQIRPLRRCSRLQMDVRFPGYNDNSGSLARSTTPLSANSKLKSSLYHQNQNPNTTRKARTRRNKWKKTRASVLSDLCVFKRTRIMWRRPPFIASRVRQVFNSDLYTISAKTENLSP